MKVAFGMKAHSGWAALVVLGTHGGQLQIVDRRRIELVAPADADWAKQPYHAAEDLAPVKARDLVKRGIEKARRHAIVEMRLAHKRARDAGHQLVACAVLMGAPMPDWTVDEILAVHFRMHKAEGVLFRDVLARAAAVNKIKMVSVPEKQLTEYAEQSLAASRNWQQTIASLGKSVGPPWGKDQKDAALAALIALQGT